MSLELEKKRYETHNNSVEDKNYLKYLKKLLDLNPELKSPVLDYGCGPTQGLKALLKIEKPLLEVVSYDPIFFNKELNKNHFRTIYASECVEHFNSPKESLKKMIDLMSKDSCLMIRTELYDGVKEPLNSWWYFRDPTHVSFYNTKTIEKISELFNLEVRLLKSPYIMLQSN